MPRKTKKEKIIAEYRRKLQRLQPNPVVREKTVSPPVDIEPAPARPSPMTSEYDNKLYRFTLTDMRKTLIITLAILALEFLVFYASLKGILIKF